MFTYTTNLEHLAPSTSTTPLPNGLNDERLTDSVIDSKTSLASEDVLGSGHETDSTPVQSLHLSNMKLKLKFSTTLWHNLLVVLVT